MNQLPATVHIMTAGLTPGDAVSNFAVTCGRILRRLGATVFLYADSIAPEYGAIARHSRHYPATGHDLLWFHYSIHADNVALALASPDQKIMDFHGICPPHLFSGHNEHLAQLCQTGLDVLPSLHDRFDRYVVHSEYSRHWLTGLGFPPDRIDKLFYTIDTADFTGADAALAPWLARLEYFLMVGRVVPQKDVLALLEIFGHLHRQQPDAALFLVGSRHQAPRYQRQIDRTIARLGLQERVMLTGQVSNPAVLEALFRHARMLFVTSEWESFCVPIAESLYFGVPAAVVDIPPMPEIAGPGGLVIDKGDPAAAARQVLALLDDPDRYDALRQAARTWADQYAQAALEAALQDYFRRLPPVGERSHP